MYIVGQEQLLKEINNLNYSYPRFSIIIGQKGSGRKTITKYIADMLGCYLVEADNKVEYVRQVIESSYIVQYPTMYIFADAQNMSQQAKNSLLKITEEPPNNAYFILTVEDESQVIDTLKSRAYMFKIDKYTPDDLIHFYINCSGDADGDMNKIRELCDVPGDVDLLLQYDMDEFYKFAEKVVNNIIDADEANVYKIGQKLKLKDEDSGYDLKLFFKAFCILGLKELYADEGLRYLFPMIRLTNKYIDDLNVRSLNKQMLLDNWIIDMRENVLYE